MALSRDDCWEQWMAVDVWAVWKSDRLCNFRRDWLLCWRRLFKQTVCRHNPNQFTRKPEAMQVHRSALTFPAPTGPMTVRSWCDFTVTEMFCSDGASKLFDKRKTPGRFSTFTSFASVRNVTLRSQHSPYPSSRSASPSQCSFPSFPPAAAPSVCSPRLTGGGNSARGLINTHAVTLWSMKTKPTQLVVCVCNA